MLALQRKKQMLFNCDFSKELWTQVNEWIIELDLDNYNLAKTKIVVGDLENAPVINSVIIVAKKIICNAIKGQKTQILKNEI